VSASSLFVFLFSRPMSFLFLFILPFFRITYPTLYLPYAPWSFLFSQRVSRHVRK
jgi:hypothetical protein